CKTLSIYVYRALRVCRDLLVPATIAATHRADIHLVVIDHHPDNGTARSPWDSDRVGFNFNFFSVRKLVQHVCVKLLRHRVLLSESIKPGAGSVSAIGEWYSNFVLFLWFSAFSHSR